MRIAKQCITMEPRNALSYEQKNRAKAACSYLHWHIMMMACIEDK